MGSPEGEERGTLSLSVHRRKACWGRPSRGRSAAWARQGVGERRQVPGRQAVGPARAEAEAGPSVAA